MANNLIDADKRFPGVIHFVDREIVIGSRGCYVTFSQNSGKDWTELFAFPLSLLSRFKSCSNLSRRLFREGIHYVLRDDKKNLTFLAFGKIYKYNLKNRILSCTHFTLPGSRPLTFCNAGDGRLYFGEYRNNPERSPVHVFESKDGGYEWKVVWEFREIRHVHGVFHDPYANYIWITTGDENQESGIWFTKNNFKTIEKIVGGSQQTRAIQLLFTESHVYFGSDTPFEQNWIYRISRNDGHIEQLQAVDGSIFCGCKVGSKLFFSTACEPSEANRSKKAVIWMSRDGAQWERFFSLRKDFLPMTLFQYGQIRFPSGPGDDSNLWISPLATENDQVSLKFIFRE